MNAQTAVIALMSDAASGAVEASRTSSSLRAAFERRLFGLISKPLRTIYCARNSAFSFAVDNKGNVILGLLHFNISLVRVAASKTLIEIDVRSINQQVYCVGDNVRSSTAL